MQTQKCDLALEMEIKKAKMIKQTQVSIVSTECGACRMQITNALKQQNVKAIFKNPI